MTALLQSYWDAHLPRHRHSVSHHPPSPIPDTSPTLDHLHRPGIPSSSDANAKAPALPLKHRLSPYHPAWSLTKLLDRFGPLIFPVYRAALLRKRILISCHVPVREICDFGASCWLLPAPFRIPVPCLPMPLLGRRSWSRLVALLMLTGAQCTPSQSCPRYPSPSPRHFLHHPPRPSLHRLHVFDLYSPLASTTFPFLPEILKHPSTGPRPVMRLLPTIWARAGLHARRIVFWP